MNEEMEKIYATLYEREIEIKNLRQGYIITSNRYTEAIESLRKLTINTAMVANLAETATNKSLLAAKKAAIAVNLMITTTDAKSSDVASKAGSEAAAAAAEASAAATLSSTAAEQAADSIIKTVSRHSELAAIENAKEAKLASERAFAAAAEAAKIAGDVSSVLKTKQ